MTIKTKISQIIATGWLINSSNRGEGIKILKKQIAELLEMQAKNLHKPPITISYDVEDMREAYEYGKGYGTGNFDEWLKNRNCY